jgi:hypothetical protein
MVRRRAAYHIIAAAGVHDHLQDPHGETSEVCPRDGLRSESAESVFIFSSIGGYKSAQWESLIGKPTRYAYGNIIFIYFNIRLYLFSLSHLPTHITLGQWAEKFWVTNFHFDL